MVEAHLRQDAAPWSRGGTWPGVGKQSGGWIWTEGLLSLGRIYLLDFARRFGGSKKAEEAFGLECEVWVRDSH